MGYEHLKPGTMVGNYIIEEEIGEGGFSVVYRAIDTRNQKQVVLKAITKITKIKRTADELSFLLELNTAGAENVVKLIDCFRIQEQIIAVFPNFKNISFSNFLKRCTIKDIKFYMYNLFKGVRSLHDSRIIHRDIKPENFIYNSDLKTGYIIDLGLAQRNKYTVEKKEKKKPVNFFSSFVQAQTTNKCEVPGYTIGDSRPNMKACRNGTRGFRAPEVLFKYCDQNEKIDIWSCGVVFLTLLSRRHPFFQSTDDINGLVEIAYIYGNKEMKLLAHQLKRTWKTNLDGIPYDKISFYDIIKRYGAVSLYGNDEFIEAIDLLEKLMELDPDKRISADDALKHHFFSY